MISKSYGSPIRVIDTLTRLEIAVNIGDPSSLAEKSSYPRIILKKNSHCDNSSVIKRHLLTSLALLSDLSLSDVLVFAILLKKKLS